MFKTGGRMDSGRTAFWMNRFWGENFWGRTDCHSKFINNRELESEYMKEIQDRTEDYETTAAMKEKTEFKDFNGLTICNLECTQDC